MDLLPRCKAAYRWKLAKAVSIFHTFGGRVYVLQGAKVMGEEPELVEEIKKMEYEPLLSAEKQLLRWAIALGVILIGILIFIHHTFFPAQ